MNATSHYALLIAIAVAASASAGPVVTTADARQKVRKTQQAVEQYKTAVNQGQSPAA